MTIARIVLSTIVGIPRALRLVEPDLDDLYEIAETLQRVRNDVLVQALDLAAGHPTKVSPRPDAGPDAA